MNQTKNLDIALIEVGNSEKVLTVQEKELDIRYEQIKFSLEQKRETSKLFTKVLDKFIHKKEIFQDVFIGLKTQLEIQHDILREEFYQKNLSKITDDFINSDSV